MSDIFTWISLEWVLQTGFAVTLLIGLVLLVRRPFARMFGAGAAYALWLLPVMRLFMPNITVPRISPERATDPIPEVVSITALPEIAVLAPEMFGVVAKPSLTFPVLPLIMGIWLIGAAIFFLYHWLRQAAYMDKLLYQSEPAQGLPKAMGIAASVSGLKHIPQVKISDDNRGPMVTGLLRPVVILPSDFTESYSAEQQHYALLHEFMHIKRGDLFVAVAWLAFRALNWPNPLVHYAGVHFRSDQEAACDASVLKALGGDRKTLSAYAETLVHAAKAATEAAKRNGRASPHSSHLALTIHHPLKERLMILGTHKKVSTWRTRSAAAIMILGAAALTAPLTQATSHPDEELAGKPHALVKNKSKSVIKFNSGDNGEKISKHFEITIDGDKVEAFEIDNAGRKTSIDPNDIEGFDLEDIKGAKAFSFGMDKDHKLKFMSKDDFAHWRDGDFKEWKEGDFKDWIKNLEEGEHRFKFADIPHPPLPPGLSNHSENVFVFESDDFEELEGLEGLEKLKALKSLNGLEKLKVLEALRGEDIHIKMRMQSAGSMLEAAESLIEQAKEQGAESRKISKAKRELEKARRSLKDAERALKED